MKKFFFVFILIFLFNVFLVSAEDRTIYDLLETVTEGSGHILVLGDDSPASDSLAATSIATGIQSYSGGKTKLKATLASEIISGKMILLGNPCENVLINLSCAKWPYDSGEVLIKVSGNNLIVSGSTAEDTRNAAKIIAKYRDYPLLKKYDQVILTGTGLNSVGIIAEPKQDVDFEENTSNISEEESCYGDCFAEKDNLTVKVQEEQSDDYTIVPEDEEERGFLKRIWRWIAELFKD